MKVKILFLLTVILSGMIILSACASEAPTEEPQEPPKTEAPEPNPEAPQEESVPYPYPAPGEDAAIQPGDSAEAYPSPQEEIAAINPYPGVEVVGSASDRDLSEAITAAEFTVLTSDEDLLVDSVFIDQSEIVMSGSNPVQVELILVGNLPTPCHQLRVVNAEPDEKGRIEIQAYTVSDPDKMCTQVLKPFIAIVPLGEYTDGTFNLSINYEISGEFSIP